MSAELGPHEKLALMVLRTFHASPDAPPVAVSGVVSGEAKPKDKPLNPMALYVVYSALLHHKFIVRPAPSPPSRSASAGG